MVVVAVALGVPFLGGLRGASTPVAVPLLAPYSSASISASITAAGMAMKMVVATSSSVMLTNVWSVVMMVLRLLSDLVGPALALLPSVAMGAGMTGPMLGPTGASSSSFLSASSSPLSYDESSYMND